MRYFRLATDTDRAWFKENISPGYALSSHCQKRLQERGISKTRIRHCLEAGELYSMRIHKPDKVRDVTLALYHASHLGGLTAIYSVAQRQVVTVFHGKCTPRKKMLPYGGTLAEACKFLLTFA